MSTNPLGVNAKTYDPNPENDPATPGAVKAKKYSEPTDGEKLRADLDYGDSEEAKTYNRNWPKSKRDKAPKEDFAGPHESFPIETQADVDAAAHLVGKAADPAAVKARIKAIAKRKGLKVPESWTGNETPESPTLNPTGNTVDKTQLVAWLTANCDCWKGKDDAAILNGLSEDKLKTLKAGAENAKTAFASEAAARQELATANSKVAELTANAAKATPPAPQHKTMEEYVASLPPQVQELIKNAHGVVQNEKKNLVEKLLANVKDEAAKKAKTEKFMGMKLEDLQELYDLMPTPAAPPQVTNVHTPFAPGFFGMAGGNPTPTTNDAGKTDGGSVPLPTINYEDFASPGLVEKLGRRKTA